MRVYTIQKTSEHMACVHVKHWLAYCISIGVQMIYTLSLTRARNSVNSHVTQIHSRKQCKPGKYAGCASVCGCFPRETVRQLS